jgi:hypothetical protein
MRFLCIIAVFSLAFLAAACTIPKTAGIETGGPSASTQPSSIPAAADKVVEVVHDVVVNPAVTAATSPIPYANLVLGLVGTLTGLYSTWRHLSAPAPLPPTAGGV